MGCEALATKAEVAQLRETVAVLAGQLAAKIDKADRGPIVEDSINGANARYGLAIVPVALPALSQLIPYIAGLISLISSFFGLQNLINGLRSLINSQQSDIDRILGRLRFIEDKNSEQDQLLHYFRDYIIPILKADIIILERELKKANNEIKKGNAEIARLNSELKKANAEINKANIQINLLSFTANEAIAEAKQARAETKAIRSELESQYKPIIQLAISKADFAIQTINNLGNDLIEELQTQSGKISNLESQNARLAVIANSARTDANRAIEIANNALSASQQAQSTSNNAASTANTVSQEVRNGVQIRYFEPTITNAIVRINQQVTNTSIQQASNEIQQRLTQGNQQINQQFAAAAQASTQIRNISIAEASAEIQRQLTSASNDIQRTLSEAGARVRATVEPLVLERAIAASPTIQDLKSRTTAPTIQPALQAEVASLRGRITEQERMNERGLTEIGVIAGAIAALPNTFAQNPTYRAAMTDVAAAGTCRTTQPGGCMANQVQSLRNGQNDILSKLNLGVEAGQGAVLSAMQNTLNTVNAKLGAQIPGIGIGGKLSNFVNWSVADRVMNIVTMLASLHNVLLLSNSVKETFLDVLDNVFQTGFNIAPNIFKKADENEAVDSRKFLGGALNSFFGSLFGVSEWAAIQAQWKAYSTIYSSSAQGINNVRELTNDVQELANINIKQTAELGNALVDEGVISEDNWEHKDPKKKIKSKSLRKLQRMGQGIEALDNKLEAIEMVTATVLNITNTAKEIKENIDEIEKAVDEANKAAKKDRDAKIEGLELPNFSLDDIF